MVNWRGKLGLRSFSIAPFSHTAPIRILTHTMLFIPRNLLVEGTRPLHSTRRRDEGARTDARTGGLLSAYSNKVVRLGADIHRRALRRVFWRSVFRAVSSSVSGRPWAWVPPGLRSSAPVAAKKRPSARLLKGRRPAPSRGPRRSLMARPWPKSKRE